MMTARGHVLLNTTTSPPKLQIVASYRATVLLESSCPFLRWNGKHLRTNDVSTLAKLSRRSSIHRQHRGLAGGAKIHSHVRTRKDYVKLKC